VGKTSLDSVLFNALYNCVRQGSNVGNREMEVIRVNATRVKEAVEAITKETILDMIESLQNRVDEGFESLEKELEDVDSRTRASGREDRGSVSEDRNDGEDAPSESESDS